MSLTHPTNIGIIACPGGENFADSVLPHLKRLYRRQWQRIAAGLAKKYNREETRVMEDMNFFADLDAVKIGYKTPVDTYVPPRLKVPARYFRFANGEYKAEILASIRQMDIFIFQDVENHYPLKFYKSDEPHVLSVQDHVFILFSTIDAVQQASTGSVTLVLPAYPFSRQHRKKAREGLTASWFGRVCEYMGVNRIITLDIHSKEIENSFNTLHLENLHGSYQVLRKLLEMIDLKTADLVVVSPDTGAVDRNKFYADSLQKPLAMLYKERDYSKVSRDAGENNIMHLHLLGDVRSKTVFMADDLLGTGGTLITAMRTLKEMGAERIICAISLPLFNGPALDHFDAAYDEGLFYRIIGTDAVFHDELLLGKEWYVSAGVSSLFASIIHRLHHGRSLSSLLDNRKIIQRLLNEAQR